MQITIVERRIGSIDELQEHFGGGLQRHMREVLTDVINEGARVGEQSAEIHAPERTRRLKREISRTRAHSHETGPIEASVGVGRVFSASNSGAGPLREGQAEYPLRVHEGTGIYGALHRAYGPKHAKRMRWVENGGLIFALRVRGQRPQPYMREAFHDVSEYIEGRIGLMVAQIFDRR